MLFLGVLDSDGDCQWNEGHLNAWDGPIDATCNPGYAVAGFYSVHNNGKEDRKWKMNCCKVVHYSPRISFGKLTRTGKNVKGLIV